MPGRNCGGSDGLAQARAALWAQHTLPAAPPTTPNALAPCLLPLGALLMVNLDLAIEVLTEPIL